MPAIGSSPARAEEERAYYDWVGYIFLFVTVCALLPMPFAGYWLMRSVYAYSQSMGVTMMGGLLTWLFVVQALLIGALFLGVNYYLWQSMGRIRGGERYQSYYQYLLLALTGCSVYLADAAHDSHDRHRSESHGRGTTPRDWKLWRHVVEEWGGQCDDLHHGFELYLLSSRESQHDDLLG